MNFHHKATKICITGLSGSGKTTLFLREITAFPAKWKFAFDPEREISFKTKWPIATTIAQMNGLTARFQPFCFDPGPMFGNWEEGFAFFATWVLNVSAVLKGRKLLCGEELQEYACLGNFGLTPSFRRIIDLGRRAEIDLIFVSQRLNDVNHKLRSQLTAVDTFRHTDYLPLNWLKALGFDTTEVSNLPYPGGHIRKNLLNGEIIKYSPNGQRMRSDSKALDGAKA